MSLSALVEETRSFLPYELSDCQERALLELSQFMQDRGSYPAFILKGYAGTGKTSFIYHLRDRLKENQDYLKEHLEDLCSVLQDTIIKILMKKLALAVKDTGIKEVALSGGVSANSGLRREFLDYAEKFGWKVHIPPFAYTTDNVAMVAMAGYFRYLKGEYCHIDLPPYSRTIL